MQNHVCANDLGSKVGEGIGLVAKFPFPILPTAALKQSIGITMALENEPYTS